MKQQTKIVWACILGLGLQVGCVGSDQQQMDDALEASAEEETAEGAEPALTEGTNDTSVAAQEATNLGLAEAPTDLSAVLETHTAPNGAAMQPTTEAPAKVEAAPAATEAGFVVYKVQAGDWLSKLAKRVYNDPHAFHKIQAANAGIKNPNLIFPGQDLKIAIGSAAERAAALALPGAHAL